MMENRKNRIKKCVKLGLKNKRGGAVERLRNDEMKKKEKDNMKIDTKDEI